MTSSPTHVSVPIAAALGTTGTGSEASRSFFQERLRLFAGWTSVLAFTFFVVTFTTQLIVRPAASAHLPLLGPPQLFHLTICLANALVWFVLRGRTLSFDSLRALETADVLITSTAFAFMASAYAISRSAGPVDPAYGLTAGLLGCTNVLITRAVLIPSRSYRTAILSTAAMLPVVAATAYTLTVSAVAVARDEAIFVTIVAAAWSGLATAVATIGSHIIFGLRKDVALARQIGQYTLDEKIGEGGMGVVYKARHALLRRPTAIKLLPPERAGVTNLRRFEREVQQTARLTHPNTVAIYDYGRTPGGVFYYAMEFLDGVTLDELVRSGGPLPAARAIHILRQVCSALGEAHDLGLVHRDIKPANIILSERGGDADVVKVLDFGLVRHIDTSGTEMTATAANVLTGTPLYMSPESIKSEDAVDGRSDLYALGAVGYYLLTGAPVFDARTIVEVCAHHLHTTPLPPSQRTKRVIPADLEAAVLLCLAKSPSDRPRSARALRDLLDRCADAGAWSAEEASRWWTEWRTRPRPPRDLSSDAETPSLEHTVAVDLSGRVGV